MKQGFKYGLGLALGAAAGRFIIGVVSTTIDRWFMKQVNDDNFMAALKIRKPDLHGRLIKYRKYD